MKLESKIQQECFVYHWNNFPNQRGLLFMNYNNPKNAAHGAVLKSMGLVKGVADMTLIRSGKPTIFLEFKTDIGRQSKAQKEWENSVRAAGCEYVIIRSLEDFKSVVG